MDVVLHAINAVEMAISAFHDAHHVGKEISTIFL
jgi:hypothetical protein